MVYQDSFGFLNHSLSFELENVKIFPRNDFREHSEKIKSIINKDGYYYPPDVYNVEYPINNPEDAKVIPNTKRPAQLYRLPHSHSIEINSEDNIQHLRNNDAGFLIHFLGFLYGTRLQFHDWYFEGRVPISPHQWFYAAPRVANQVLNLAYQFWRNIDETLKRIFINVLFMHIKAKCYEWDWEKFTVEYMVFDALYKLTISNYSDCNVSRTHPERLKTICEYYKIKYNESTLDKIAKLRRELYHETLWDGELPTAAKSHFSFYAADHLHRLNDRIITSLIGYHNDFSKSNWEGVVAYSFDEIRSI